MCGERDITLEFLDSVNNPMVVTCKNYRVDFVDDLCAQAGLEAPIHYNCGYYKNREGAFLSMAGDAITHLNDGYDVVLHCRSGVHRAALTAAELFMFGLKIPFARARKLVERSREVRINEIVHGSQREDGSWTENHMDYIPRWEAKAMNDNLSGHLRFAAPLQQPDHTIDVVVSESDDSYEDNDDAGPGPVGSLVLPRIAKRSRTPEAMPKKVPRRRTVRFEEGVVSPRPQYCRHKSQQTLGEYLRSERDNLTDLFCQACVFFKISRSRVKRYVRSCEGAALRLEGDKEISGIFAPETQANILEALQWHRYINNDTSLEELRNKIPSVLFEKAHGKMPEAGEQKSNNNNAKRKRKTISESLQKARQIVKWNVEVDCWREEWVTKKQLVADFGEEKAEKMWLMWCFTGERKFISAFQEPVSHAQALAIWLNIGLSWEDSLVRWQQHPESSLSEQLVDDISRKRIRETLHYLIP